MSDEIKNQNVIQLYHAQDLGWYARVGPHPGGLETGPHESAAGAMAALFREMVEGGWVFDPSWQPAD